MRRPNPLMNRKYIPQRNSHIILCLSEAIMQDHGYRWRILRPVPNSLD